MILDSLTDRHLHAFCKEVAVCLLLCIFCTAPPHNIEGLLTKVVQLLHHCCARKHSIHRTVALIDGARSHAAAATVLQQSNSAANDLDVLLSAITGAVVQHWLMQQASVLQRLGMIANQ
jgi:hypothetical protein